MPSIETRKLIRVGAASLGIIVPKPWLDYHKLKYGDKVVIITNGDIHIKRI